MRKIGFISSRKENEKRKGIVYEDVLKIVNKSNLYFEKNYFLDFGIKDEEIVKLGCNIATFEEIIEKCDVLIDPKIGDSNSLDQFKSKILFGWIHATQNKEIADSIINSKSTAIAFEKMYEDGIHSFYKNNQLAGLVAVYHSMLCYGKNYNNLNAAVLGNGNTSIGAVEALKRLGANVKIYKRADEEQFKQDFYDYDIIVNAVLWDVKRKDHVIYNENLIKMKKQAIIIDVSCDRSGAIESSVPTTIDNPTYIIDGVMHYVVDHTSSLLYKDASASISEQIVKYIDQLILEEEALESLFNKALIIKDGIILDNEIKEYQNRK